MNSYFRVEEAAHFLGLSPKTLNRWRSVGGGPVFHRVGGRAIRYRLEDLKEFAEKGARRSTSDKGYS